MKQDRTHYVYIYSCKGVPFYVGKGVGGRFSAHVERDDFPPLDDVTISFETFRSDEEALAREAVLIRALGLRATGGVLINKVVPQVYSTGAEQQGETEVVPTSPANSSAILFSVKDCCQRLTVSRATLYKLIGSGTLRAKKMGARTVIPAEELRRYTSSLQDTQPSFPS